MESKTTIVLRNAYHGREVRFRVWCVAGWALMSRRQYDRAKEVLCGNKNCKHCEARFGNLFNGQHEIPEYVNELWSRETDRHDCCPNLVWERVA